MIRLLTYVLIMLLTSMYCYPFEFTFLPGVNTKMMIAAAGLVIYLMHLARRRDTGLSRNMLTLMLIAALGSVWCYAATVINNTSDYEYASYFISMWVWVGGAYAVVEAIRARHGSASIVLITNYLTAAAVFQCLSALAIDNIPAVKTFSLMYFDLGQEWLESVDRLYGFGASVDPAGIKFALILTLITGVLTHITHTSLRKYIWLYIVSYVIIYVVGNMIARTTTVGIMMSALMVGLHMVADNRKRRAAGLRRSYRTFLNWTLIAFCGFVVCVYFYQISEPFRENLRFAFEGFFSLYEKGSWDVASNNKLATMYVWPETLHTWLIGDGYLSNPYYTDPLYTGPLVEGYYMGTDVGYLRFIFYFGLPGLLIFSWFFIKAGQYCARISPDYKRLFFFLILANFIIWFKVATDCFVIIALFLMLDPGEDTAYNRRIALRPHPTKYVNVRAMAFRANFAS